MNKLISLCIGIGILSSCGIKKITTIDFADFPENPTELIERVNSKNSQSQWASLKGRIHIVNKEKDITLNINIKNKRDSIIWISARAAFGIEIFRAQLMPDSLYLINRINKTYLIKPAPYIKDFIKSDFSFYDFQQIIMGSPKIPKDNYKLIADEIGFHLSSDNASYSVTNKYKVYNAKFTNNNMSLEFTLEDYQVEDNFPRKVKIKAEEGEIFAITINYSEVEFSKSQNFLFVIPDAYEEIK